MCEISKVPKIPLTIHSEDIKPTEYDSLQSASEDIGVHYQTGLCAYGNRNPSITTGKDGNKTFYIKWLN